jgi:hypothetical protein
MSASDDNRGISIPKTTVIIVSGLIVVIALVTVAFLMSPSGSPGMDPSAPPLPVTAETTTEITVTAVSAADATVTGLSTLTPATPPDDLVQEQPAVTPEPVFAPDVLTPQTTFFSITGDPLSILAPYQSFFNSSNTAGMYALLSKNMSSHYPADTLNNELAAARSKGYSIESIEVPYQVLDEQNATLELIISWKVAGSPRTSTPSLSMVYENAQWKMDSLILSPDTV